MAASCGRVLIFSSQLRNINTARWLAETGDRLCYTQTCLRRYDRSPTLVPSRQASSFFVHISGEDLWKGATSVSNAGMKKGRGKRVGRKKTTDLNKGQVLGTGWLNYGFPGLNVPIVQGKSVTKLAKLPPNPERRETLIRLRDEMGKIRHIAGPSLLRGWSSTRFPGQDVGPPNPIAGYNFDDFESRCLEFRMVNHMSGNLGRKMTFTAFVVTGNKRGIAGFGSGQSPNGRAAVRLAKNRAAQRLRYIELYNNHTVFHNMHTENHHSKIFIHKKEEGYGLRCHRALRTICQVIGIKDLHCKVEGNTGNIRAITNAFFDALTHQETHAALAERMGYHVVEINPKTNGLPIVVASPPPGEVKREPLRDEKEDLEAEFDRLYYGGRCELVRPPKKWFYANFDSYLKKQAIVHARRNQGHARVLRKAGLS